MMAKTMLNIYLLDGLSNLGVEFEELLAFFADAFDLQKP